MIVMERGSFRLLRWSLSTHSERPSRRRLTSRDGPAGVGRLQQGGAVAEGVLTRLIFSRCQASIREAGLARYLLFIVFSAVMAQCSVCMPRHRSLHASVCFTFPATTAPYGDPVRACR